MPAGPSDGVPPGRSQRTLLIVSGGWDTLDAIHEARRLGLRVVVSDGDPRAPGLRLADVGLLASTCDPDATVDAARAYAGRHRIDGVLAVGADVPVTVAAVADALGLPGPSLATARLAADKLAMKGRFGTMGVPTPWYAPVENAAALRTLVLRAGRSLILKPIDSRGGRGVIRLLPGVDLPWAFAHAERESPTGRVMVEEFVPGLQISAEGVILDGRAIIVGISDRNYELLDRFAPFVIENGGDLPTCLPAAVAAGVDGLIGEAARALGVRNGTVRGDVVVGPNGPVMIDLAVQLSGGFLCAHEISLASGVNVVEAGVRLALGEAVHEADLMPRWSRGVARRYLLPAPGTVVSVGGIDEVSHGEGIALLEMRVALGTTVRPVTSHVCRGGVVIAVADTRDEAVRRARAAVARVRIVTRPTTACSPLR